MVQDLIGGLLPSSIWKTVTNRVREAKSGENLF